MVKRSCDDNKSVSIHGSAVSTELEGKQIG
jgi:hypothetical protein